MSVLDLLRPELRDFAGYGSARRAVDPAMAAADLWLNANESPHISPGDPSGEQRRYPEPQPLNLRKKLAAVYGVAPEQLLIGRGSDEGIDLLVRALCRAGRDAVVICPPVFGMYAVSARLQNAPLVEVPLIDGRDGFQCDLDAVAAAAVGNGAKVVFLCSPANPTGQSLTLDEIDSLASRLADRAVLVVDEAYIEFSEQPSCTGLLASHDNLVVLRTLSKAYALAGARVGAVLAAPELITVLRNCQAPYPLPVASVTAALATLTDEARSSARHRVVTLRAERERLLQAITRMPGVRRVYPSDGNFLLVRFDDAETCYRQLLAAGIVVRDMRAMPQLGDALRISIGSAKQNLRLEAALAEAAAA